MLLEGLWNAFAIMLGVCVLVVFDVFFDIVLVSIL